MKDLNEPDEKPKLIAKTKLGDDGEPDVLSFAGFAGVVGLTGLVLALLTPSAEFEREERTRDAYTNYWVDIFGSDYERHKVLNANLNASTLKIIMEANILNAKSKEQEARAKIMMNVADIIRPENLSPALIKALVISIINPDGLTDPETKEQLDKFLIQTAKANADNATNETDFRKWKNERTKRKDTD